MEYRHLLVTGGAGFIGSNFVHMAMRRDDDLHITNLDLLSYSGNLDNLKTVDAAHGASGDGRYRFVKGDIGDQKLVAGLLGAAGDAPPIDGVVHFAAESHVDRSILGPETFVQTNVMGTCSLLEACRTEFGKRDQAFRFVHVSTDEVYGSLGADDPAFTEQTPLSPNSPYSASKAGSDLLVRSYVETFGFPALITRCSNNYGPYQFPEKLIPMMITQALNDAPLGVYGDGKNVRDWIQVEDHCDAIWTLLHRGDTGKCYNIGGEAEVTNLEIVHAILDLLDKPKSLIQFVADRPAHDRRYAMNIEMIRTELGWKPSCTLAEGLQRTVSWYRDNEDWWRPLLTESRTVARNMYQK